MLPAFSWFTHLQAPAGGQDLGGYVEVIAIAAGAAGVAIKPVRERAARFAARFMRALRDAESLSRENASLRAENATLRDENARASDEKRLLRESRDDYSDFVADLSHRITLISEQLELCRADLERFQQVNRDLHSAAQTYRQQLIDAGIEPAVPLPHFLPAIPEEV